MIGSINDFGNSIRNRATTLAAVFAGIGGFVLAFVLAAVAYLDHSEKGDCRKALAALEKPEAAGTDGGFKVLGFSPDKVSFNATLCVVVTGVTPGADETRLKQVATARTSDARDAQAEYESALRQANAAEKLATEEEVKAGAAERGSDTTASAAARANATTARADAKGKATTRAGALKKLEEATKAQDDAHAAANKGLPPVDVTLYLNDRRTQLTAKAKAQSRPQILQYDLVPPADATGEPAGFWRAVLGGKATQGAAEFDVGVSRTATSAAEATDTMKKLKFVVYHPVLLGLGGLSMVCFLAAFVLSASASTLLRDGKLTRRDAIKALEDDLEKAKQELAAKQGDKTLEAAVAAAQKKLDDRKNRWRSETLKVEVAAAAAALAKADEELKKNQADAALKQAVTDAQKALDDTKAKWDYLGANADRPAGTFSLARTQMAVWLLLTTAGFVFLWLTLGVYKNVITAQSLVLLGISGATGLAAVAVNSLSTQTPGQPAPAEKPSKSFLHDLMSDDTGPKLHRIQVVAWTLVLAIIFVWNVIWNFSFVEFDTNLLLLMGVVSSMYIGFKPAEK
jgi:hypothetical protein